MFAVELKITSELWPRYRVHLEALIEAISDGWKRTVDRTDAEVISEADGSV